MQLSQLLMLFGLMTLVAASLSTPTVSPTGSASNQTTTSIATTSSSSPKASCVLNCQSDDFCCRLSCNDDSITCSTTLLGNSITAYTIGYPQGNSTQFSNTSSSQCQRTCTSQPLLTSFPANITTTSNFDTAIAPSSTESTTTVQISESSSESSGSAGTTSGSGAPKASSLSVSSAATSAKAPNNVGKNPEIDVPAVAGMVGLVIIGLAL